MPEFTRALVQRTVHDGDCQLAVERIPTPQPGEHEVLVKVSHVAQNPTDVQSLDGNAFGDGSVFGCDFVGSVEELGPNVERLAKGDVIAGLIWGGEVKGLGAYSDYTIANEYISFKVPSSVGATEAATVPLACTTAWLALFSKECLSIDRNAGDGASVLVWGGSSSVGSYTIQIAAHFGFKVITTCSPQHFETVKSLGASHVFDYRDPDVVASIKTAAPELEYVFDTIGAPGTSATASQAIRPDGGRLCTVRPGKANTDNVTDRTEVTDVLVWTAFLKDHSYGDFTWPASIDDHKLASELFENLPGWLADGTIKPSIPKVLKGLESVPQGFQENRDGSISGYKLVYTLE